jgi:hypothetical protein
MMGEQLRPFDDDDMAFLEGDCSWCDGQGVISCNCDDRGCSQCIDGERTCPHCNGSGFEASAEPDCDE